MIDLEKELFLEWHFMQWKLHNAVTDSVEYAKTLYDRVYSHEHLLPGRESEFKAWKASKARPGYKLVPSEPTIEMWGGLARNLVKYMQMHDRYCPKTLKKYFDRFIGEPPEWLSKEVGNWESDSAFATADLGVFIYKAMLEEA